MAAELLAHRKELEAMTDSGAERAARRIVEQHDISELWKPEIAAIIREETGTQHCELLSEARACLYMAKRHVTTSSGTGFITRCIDAIESDPDVIKYLDEAFGVLPAASDEGGTRL